MEIGMFDTCSHKAIIHPIRNIGALLWLLKMLKVEHKLKMIESTLALMDDEQ
jgi:hypothetical protein